MAISMHNNKYPCAFDPIEPDFGLVIRNLNESDASVMISSAAEIRAEMPTGATNQSTDSSSLFDVNVWIDYPNQINRFYGGYGPGLYFFVELCCDMIPSIPLPDAKKRLKDQEDIELNGCNSWTTWKEWYGDLSQLFHCFVHVPIFVFCQKRIKCKFIEIDYDKVKEMLYQEDKRFWDEEMNLK